ncbi:MAG: kelch repeat-containing protein [Myxococcota bacterium]
MRRLIHFGIAITCAVALAACESGSTTTNLGPPAKDTSSAADTTGGDAASDATTGTPDASETADDVAGPDAVEDAGDAATDATADTAEVQCGPPSGMRPPALSEHAGAYDPVGRRLIITGGSTAVSIDCAIPASTFETVTWIYDVDCGAWRKHEGFGPTARTRHAAVLAGGDRQQLIVYGGRFRPPNTALYTLRSDVWAFDLKTETWSEMPTKSGPPARVNPAMVWDSEADRLILFGGNSSTSGSAYISRNDTWTLDLKTGQWTELATTGKPDSRLFAASLWDAKRQRMIIYGGADEDAFFSAGGGILGGLWGLAITGTTGGWAQLDDLSPTVPNDRFWASMVLDAERNRYLLFGGHDGAELGNRNDLWAFDADGGTWSKVSAGDLFNKGPTGVCQFPADFTVVDADAPERREAQVFAAGGGEAYLMGGKTDCGAADDLFRLDLATATWTELVSATVGESCVRAGGVGCKSLCF